MINKACEAMREFVTNKRKEVEDQSWKANEPGPWRSPHEEAKDRAKARADAIFRQVREERQQRAKEETPPKTYAENGYEEAVAYANALAQSIEENPSDKFGMLMEQLEANRRVGIFRQQMAEDKLSKRWEQKQKEGPWHGEWVLSDSGTRIRWSSICSYSRGMGDVTLVRTAGGKFYINMKIEDVDRLMGKWGEKEDVALR